jgi:hypothetical protein
MNILNAIINASGGGALEQVGQQLGLGQERTQNVVTQLLPALLAGLKKNTASAGGVDALQNALRKGSHQRYLDDAGAVTDPAAVSEGNAILGHLLGSKDVSRAVASRAAAESGVDVSVVKQLLPIVASMAMGALSKETNGGSSFGDGVLGKLGSLLDSDGDGNVLDDLLSGLGKRLF